MVYLYLDCPIAGVILRIFIDNLFNASLSVVVKDKANTSEQWCWINCEVISGILKKKMSGINHI